MAYITNVSGFGFQIRIVSVPTFPVGFTITEFADDGDPLDITQLQVANRAMGLNGDLIVWANASPIDVSLSVIENSDSDINLGILLEANRVEKGKNSARDVITLTALYPDGTVNTFSQGIIMTGFPGISVQSAGRMKTKTYGFTFASVNTVNGIANTALNALAAQIGG